MRAAPGVDAPTTYELEGERLLILPTTAGPIRSAELLAGGRAQALLRGMRIAGDNNIFIVDLPPVFANDDAATTMARLDAYIIVVEEGKTTQREVKDVAALLGTSTAGGRDPQQIPRRPGQRRLRLRQLLRRRIRRRERNGSVKAFSRRNRARGQGPSLFFAGA